MTDAATWDARAAHAEKLAALEDYYGEDHLHVAPTVDSGLPLIAPDLPTPEARAHAWMEFREAYSDWRASTGTSHSRDVDYAGLDPDDRDPVRYANLCHTLLDNARHTLLGGA